MPWILDAKKNRKMFVWPPSEIHALFQKSFLVTLGIIQDNHPSKWISCIQFSLRGGYSLVSATALSYRAVFIVGRYFQNIAFRGGVTLDQILPRYPNLLSFRLGVGMGVLWTNFCRKIFPLSLLCSKLAGASKIVSDILRMWRLISQRTSQQFKEGKNLIQTWPEVKNGDISFSTSMIWCFLSFYMLLVL